MENLILLVHLITALAIIGLILMQQGKGAEMGASFGAGASQTLFGSGGSGNFFSRLTAIFAAIFFITSFTLAVMAKQKTAVDDEFMIPTVEEVEELPVQDSDDIPSMDNSSTNESSDIPSVDNVDSAANETDDLPETDSEVPDLPEENW